MTGSNFGPTWEAIGPGTIISERPGSTLPYNVAQRCTPTFFTTTPQRQSPNTDPTKEGRLGQGAVNNNKGGPVGAGSRRRVDYGGACIFFANERRPR